MINPIRFLFFALLCLSAVLADNGDARMLSVKHQTTEPLGYSSPGAVFISSESITNLVEYKHRFNSGNSIIRINLKNASQAGTIRDTSGLTLDLSESRTNSVGLYFRHQFGGHSVELTSWHSRAMESDSLEVLYAFENPRARIYGGIRSYVSFWGLSLTDRSSLVPFSSNYGLLDISTGSTVRFGKFSFSLTFEQSIRDGLFMDSREDIHFDLAPIHRDYSIGVNRDLGYAGRLSLHYASQKDTLNTRIYKGVIPIGDIYSFDQNTRSGGLSYTGSKYTLGVIYNGIEAKLSGSVLAPYFSDLLSTLSGARYFQQMELEAEYIDIQTGLVPITFRNFSIGLENSLLIGKGRLYSKRYSFLLLNPLSNLSIQEITVNQAIVDKVDIDISVNLFHQVDLKTKLRYYVPILLDVESAPRMKIEGADLAFDRFIEMGVDYTF